MSGPHWPDDPYAVLGVPVGASQEAIRRAYRRQVQRWHPDRHAGSAAAHAAFMAVRQAFERLNPESNRRAWDAAARAAREKSATATVFEPGGIWENWGDAVRGWWAGRRRVAVPPPPGDDATVDLFVPLALAMRGGVHEVSARVATTCPACAGRAARCDRCLGSGQILVSRAWRLSLPPGVPDGRVLRLRGVGHGGPRFSQPGHVNVVVHWTKAGLWHWRNGRIEGCIGLSARRAAAGSRYVLRTPEGKTGWIALRPGLRHGDWVTVPGVGIDGNGRPAPAWLEVVVRGGGRRSTNAS